MDQSILPGQKKTTEGAQSAYQAPLIMDIGNFNFLKVPGKETFYCLIAIIFTLILSAWSVSAFSQVSKKYQHWEDAGTGDWNNNILNDAKSNYFEGEVIPHVYVLEGTNSMPLITGQTYSFTIVYNYYQQNTNAGGFAFITTYNLNRTPALLVGASGLTPVPDNTNTVGNEGIFHSINADIISASAPVSSSSSGTFSRTVTVDFEYTGTNPEGMVEIYYGLYIAEPGQVADQGFGPTKGASSWSGGSLQTTVDSDFSGALSLQLAPDGIIRGEISGLKYSDLNKNGSRQAGEEPLAGWTFYLDLNNNEVLDTDEPTDITGPDGIFYFSVTPDADKSTPAVNDPYYVRELQDQPGWTVTQPSGGVYGPILITITDFNETGLLFGNFSCVSPVASGVPTNAMCSDGTGTATITATGGNAPYTFSRGGVTDADGIFTSLGAGTYTFLVTDANGCSDEVEVTITIPAAVVASGLATNATCSGATGTATITAEGGTGAYTYSRGGVTDADGVFTGLGAGTYTFLVTDANGCTDEVEVTITVPAAIVASGEASNATCSGATGTATITAEGGTGTYTYSRNGVTDEDGVFTGLGAGTYTFLATDANGCTDEVEVTITVPAAVVASGVATNATCSGATGTATITAEGGTGAYTYSRGGVPDADGVFTGLGAGTYTFLVTDANGCTDELEVTITVPVPVVASGVATNATCSGATGTATITAEGGTGAYTYSRNGVTDADGIFTELGAGTYTFLATDANGCSDEVEVTITVPAAVVASGIASNATCSGATGSATITAEGGTGAYTYSRGGVADTDGVFTGLSAGTYTFLVTDANGCSDEVDVTITVPAAIVASGLPTNATCSGATGSATITAEGGTGAYTYSRSGVTDADGVFTGLGAGTYTFVVTDANGCSDEVDVTITVPAAVVASGLATNATCSGATGSATITAEGGTGAYTYSRNGVTDDDGIFTGLGAGTYTFLATDANGCTDEVEVNITVPSGLIASGEPTNATCSGATGTATITAEGGTGPYIYSRNGVTDADGVFTGLGAGTHTFLVTDANGCSAGVDVTISVPAAVVASGVATNATCSGATGSATITAEGGTGAYTYSRNGVTDADGIFTGLGAGTYTFLATDANGCTDEVEVTITVPAAVVASGEASNATCSGATGTATITADGGTGAYTYSRGGVTDADGVFTGLGAGNFTFLVTDSNGCTDEVEVTITVPAAVVASGEATNATCSGATGTATITAEGGTGAYTYSRGGVTDADGVFTGLGAGTYTFLATDANGCTDEVEVTISVPSGLVASGEPTNATCSGTTGSASITAEGGTGPYAYSRNGVIDSDGVFTGLGAGTYTFLVTDANGCSAGVDVTISVPAAVLASGVATNATCSGATGSATITAEGGTGDYTYSRGAVADADGVFTGLGAGTYTFVVTDANGCSDEVDVTITVPAAVVASGVATNATCSGATGSATITAEGGTGAYTYSRNGVTDDDGIFTGLGAGTYTFLATDANGCTDEVEVNITVPSGLIASGEPTNATCSGATGTATITAEGGTGPYIYSRNGVTDADGVFTGLGAGTHTFLVTDANGCSAGVDVTISVPAAVVASAVATNATCSGATGSATITAEGGTGPYTYSRSGVTDADGIFTGLGAGTYTFLATDANGCTDAVDVSISEPAAVVASCVRTNATCSGATGTVTISATGGSGSYTYANGSGAYQTSGLFTGMAVGSYTFYAKDANGCIDDISVSITQPALPACSLKLPATLPSAGSTLNQLCASTSGGVSSYIWSVTGTGWVLTGGQGTSCIKYTAGAVGTSGTIKLTVKNSSGCYSYCSIVIPVVAEGCTPGFWKNATNYWDNKTDAVSARIAGAKSSPYNGYAITSSLFRETFGISSSQMTAVGLNSNLTLIQAINLGGGGFNKLARHATAAVLSASGLKKYTYTVGTVLTMTHDAIKYRKAEPAATKLAAANESGNCPLSSSLINPAVISSTEPVKIETSAPLMNLNIKEKLDLSVYPNPFVDEVNFRFRSPATGFATLEIFDVLGKKMAVVFKGNVEANTEQTAQFSVPAYVARTMLVYRLRVGDKIISGKVLPQE